MVWGCVGALGSKLSDAGAVRVPGRFIAALCSTAICRPPIVGRRVDVFAAAPAPVLADVDAAQVSCDITPALSGWMLADQQPGHSQVTPKRCDCSARINLHRDARLAMIHADGAGMRFVQDNGRRTIHRSHRAWVADVVGDLQTSQPCADSGV